MREEERRQGDPGSGDPGGSWGGGKSRRTVGSEPGRGRRGKGGGNEKSVSGTVTPGRHAVTLGLARIPGALPTRQALGGASYLVCHVSRAESAITMCI